MTPTSKPAGSSAFTLIVYGHDFATGCQIRWNGTAKSTVVADSKTLTATITSMDVSIPNTYPVTVTCPGSPTTNTTRFVVEYLDVTASHPRYLYVNLITQKAISGGCGSNNYCPAGTITRATTAVLLLKAEHGGGYLPPPGTGTVFIDVPLGNPYVSWVEQFYHEGITQGCQVSPPKYCPDDPVTRDQTSVFLLKARLGAGHTPPPATGTVFADVPANAFAAAWIEELYQRDAAVACSTTPQLKYCPTLPTNRGDAALLITANWDYTSSWTSMQVVLARPDWTLQNGIIYGWPMDNQRVTRLIQNKPKPTCPLTYYPSDPPDYPCSHHLTAAHATTDGGNPAKWFISTYGIGWPGIPKVGDAIAVVVRNTDGSFTVPTDAVLKYPPVDPQWVNGLGAAAGIARTPVPTTGPNPPGGNQYFMLVFVQDERRESPPGGCTSSDKGWGWFSWAVSTDGSGAGGGVWKFVDQAGTSTTTNPLLSYRLIRRDDCRRNEPGSPPAGGQLRFYHYSMLYDGGYFYIFPSYRESASGLKAVVGLRMQFNASNSFGLGSVQRWTGSAWANTSNGVVTNADLSGSFITAYNISDISDAVIATDALGARSLLLVGSDNSSTCPPHLALLRGGADPANPATLLRQSDVDYSVLNTSYSGCNGAGGCFSLSLTQIGFDIAGRPQLYGFISTIPSSEQDQACDINVQGLLPVDLQLMP